MTGVIPAESLPRLAGYRPSAERALRFEAHRLEQMLREFLPKDVMAFRFCERAFTSNVRTATTIKAWSEDTAIRDRAATFCRTYRTNCRADEYVERDLEQCAPK